MKPALDAWVGALRPDDPRFRHHQIEAVWTYRWLDAVNAELLREVLACDDHHARAAATQQLRYWHPHLSDAGELAPQVGQRSERHRPHGGRDRGQLHRHASEAFEAALDVLKHPREGHLAYAVRCAVRVAHAPAATGKASRSTRLPGC